MAPLPYTAVTVGDDRHDMDELRRGEAMGPYDLIAPIGVGGMAKVWAARVRGKSDVVAVKMLLPELAENVEFRKMFFDEARIASRVRHPNVCSTFEMGEHAGTLYLAMEWLDGPSLLRVLRPGREDVTECERIPIRPRIAARIVADAAAGLHAAHELVGEDGRPLAVVHRDVSPHNLLMTSTGEVKITDFGVAKAMGKSHMTIAGQLKGKLAYMAPEQLIGGAVDRRCDVFALGCVLYEITTGQRPFQGEFDPQVMASIMMGRYEPPSAVIPTYPHELAIIVMRALANEPDNRFASADQMREALEKYLRGSGPAVGAQQIAALLKERCGEEIEARGAAVRDERPPAQGAAAGAWAPAKPKRVSETGSGAMMLDGVPAPSRKGLLWVAVAALVGASLGVGVLSYVRAARKPKVHAVAVDVTTPTTRSTAAAGSNAATTPGGASGAASAAVAVDGDPLSRGRVHLRITPSNAIVILDGVVLPRGTETIAKPPNGSTINVLVRADKHEDTIVMVDSATPEEVEVTLVPDAVGQLAPLSMTAPSPPATVPRPRTSSGAAREGAGASAAAKDAAASPPVIDAPPNPYD